MTIGNKFLFALIIVGGFVFTSCHHSDFEIKDFTPIANPEFNGQSLKTVYLDYTGAIDNGFVIPSIRQTSGGKFIFKFSLKNNSGTTQKFLYKIYYQNESYKFPESCVVKREDVEDSLAEENFYGSWEDATIGFKQTSEIPGDNNFHTVSDSFQIVGNPRNEQKYYGPDERIQVTEQAIADKEKNIRSDSNWLKAVAAKAKKENRPVDEQVRLDAIWAVKDDNSKITVNKRWQRNPRVGKYSFILVVTPEKMKGEKQIPEFVSNINKKNGAKFSNPYYYFLFGDGKKLDGAKVLTSTDTLKVIAKPDLGKGLYVRKKDFGGDNMNTSTFRNDCGNNTKLYSDAPFSQYLNEIDTNVKMANVPVSADVSGGNYTVSDYNKQNFPESSLVTTSQTVAQCPCKTVVSDSSNHLITLTSPATPQGQWRKEDVGIRSRNGFTYGKYYFKVKMPSLLNKSKLWNGLTDALWLIYQEDAPWNYRRYSAGGYIPKPDNSTSPERKHQLAYSEIDFEILKAAHYWPATSYHEGTKVIPKEMPSDSDKIMVTCTNWDMACKDVPHYTRGADSINYAGKYFGIHRWDDYYKALTGKDAESNDSLFNGAYYWFEIDWEPTEIIWSIGPEKNKMKVVGYVNNTVSSIPDNQMLIIFTQEYHLSKWWPGMPFQQERIPFPAKDVVGNIYEIDIE